MLFDATLWWVILITGVALWIPQNAQHEGAHLLAAKHWGAETVKFWPFPGKMPNGRFAWAHYVYRGGKFDQTAMGLVSIAPQFTNTVIMSLLLGLRWRFPEMPTVAASILAGWYLTNFVDGAYNLSTFYRKVPEEARTDGWRFCKRLQWNPSTCRLASKCCIFFWAMP